MYFQTLEADAPFRNHFETALLVQSILMIAAQVCQTMFSINNMLISLLARHPLYLHPFPSKTEPRIPQLIDQAIFILAMAYLCSIYRVPLWFHVCISLGFHLAGRLNVDQNISSHSLPDSRSIWNLHQYPWLRSPWSRKYTPYSSTHQARTLPRIPHEQRLILSINSNYRQRSLYGFRLSTLIGWFGGDTFKWVFGTSCCSDLTELM